MKQWNLVLIILLSSSLAAARTFKDEDFNQMIQENQKIEQDLRSHLQKEAGIVLNDRPGHVAKEKITAPKNPEQVIVQSSHSFWIEARIPSEKSGEKEKMNRISQELDEALEN